MDPLVGEVSLAFSGRWDGVTATQPGEHQWSLLPATATDARSCKRVPTSGIFSKFLEANFHKKITIPVSLASPWQGAEV